MKLYMRLNPSEREEISRGLAAGHTLRQIAANLKLSYPEQIKLTLTYDRGSEMSKHMLFSEKTNMRVYFADPHSPWQRGTNENTNGFIRQYFPKGISFRNVTREEIKLVQDQLNSRPRQSLGYKTPFERCSELLEKKGEAVPGTGYVALEG